MVAHENSCVRKKDQPAAPPMEEAQTTILRIAGGGGAFFVTELFTVRGVEKEGARAPKVEEVEGREVSRQRARC